MKHPIAHRRLLALLAAALIAASPSPAPAETVSFETDDGYTIVGELQPARPEAPAAILLHQYRTDRSTWAPLVPRLRAAGWTVLAIDQRTHGESTRRGDETVRVADIHSNEFGPIVREGPRDVAAARAFLARRGLGAGGLALVGASYGCSVSLLAAQAQPDVDAIVLLSPGVRYFRVPVTQAAAGFPGALLAVGAEDDHRRHRDARALVDAHSGRERLVVYPTGGHGTALLTTRPEVVDVIVEFLGAALSP
jgi:pimeloyl-ACP methyl ester carboxylesterase